MKIFATWKLLFSAKFPRIYKYTYIQYGTCKYTYKAWYMQIAKTHPYTLCHSSVIRICAENYWSLSPCPFIWIFLRIFHKSHINTVTFVSELLVRRPEKTSANLRRTSRWRRRQRWTPGLWKRRWRWGSPPSSPSTSLSSSSTPSPSSGGEGRVGEEEACQLGLCRLRGTLQGENFNSVLIFNFSIRCLDAFWMNSTLLDVQIIWNQ